MFKMKAEIKVLMKDKLLEIPVISEKGDWIDLRAAEDVEIALPSAKREQQVNNVKLRKVTINNQLVSLGVAIKLPKGYEAIVAPRSSSYKNFGVILSNSIGVIDNSYCGPDDIWKFNAIALKPCTIKKGDRICQFRIQLSQKATIWQKIKWLFTNGVRIKVIHKFNDKNRGGIGSTGVK